MFRGFEVVLVFVMILAIGYVSVSPEPDEADELVQGSSELDESDELVDIGYDVTWIKLHLIDSNHFSPVHPIHSLITFPITRFSELGLTEITCSRRC